ncbi:MAG: hypothetical protein JWO15_1566 [Sphingomonadales bacterium]|nr:hypothetical protein [Sphingomonadales bacterium]
MLGIKTGDKLRFSIRFRDGAGVEHSKTVDGQTSITFDGASPGQHDCTTGANGSIEIDNAENDLLAQSAGDYMDRLQLSAEPA